MGLSSKKTKTKSESTQSVAPNAIYAPQINDAAAQLRPGFDQATANNKSLLDKYVNPSLDYYKRVQGGEFLQGNPYLQGVLDDTNADIRDEVATQFSGAGRYGSGYHAGVVADRVAENENRLRYGDYATERGYQQQAGSQMAPLIGLSTALPQAAGSAYADQISQLLGRYITGNEKGTSTSKTSGGFLGDLILASVAGASKAAGGGAG